MFLIFLKFFYCYEKKILIFQTIPKPSPTLNFIDITPYLSILINLHFHYSQ